MEREEKGGEGEGRQGRRKRKDNIGRNRVTAQKSAWEQKEKRVAK